MAIEVRYDIDPFEAATVARSIGLGQRRLMERDYLDRQFAERYERGLQAEELRRRQMEDALNRERFAEQQRQFDIGFAADERDRLDRQAQLEQATQLRYDELAQDAQRQSEANTLNEIRYRGQMEFNYDRIRQQELELQAKGYVRNLPVEAQRELEQLDNNIYMISASPELTESERNTAIGQLIARRRAIASTAQWVKPQQPDTQQELEKSVAQLPNGTLVLRQPDGRWEVIKEPTEQTAQPKQETMTVASYKTLWEQAKQELMDNAGWFSKPITNDDIMAKAREIYSRKQKITQQDATTSEQEQEANSSEWNTAVEEFVQMGFSPDEANAIVGHYKAMIDAKTVGNFEEAEQHRLAILQIQANKQ